MLWFNIGKYCYTISLRNENDCCTNCQSTQLLRTLHSIENPANIVNLIKSCWNSFGISYTLQELIMCENNSLELWNQLSLVWDSCSIIAVFPAAATSVLHLRYTGIVCQVIITIFQLCVNYEDRFSKLYDWLYFNYLCITFEICLMN